MVGSTLREHEYHDKHLPLPLFNLLPKETIYISTGVSSLCLENSLPLISTCPNPLILYDKVKNSPQVSTKTYILNSEMLHGEILVSEVRTKVRIFTITTVIQPCTGDPRQFLILGIEQKTGQTRALTPRDKKNDFKNY